jgi:hypothetical protein
MLSRLGKMGGVVNKGRNQKLRRRRRTVQRQSLLERLEPRVVLNGAPVAVADPWYSTPVNTTLNVTTQGTTLVANDWDPESSAISASLVSNPSHGSVSNFQSNGTFSYTPTSGYAGFDSFTYRVNDGTTDSNTVAASIAVGGYLGPRTNQDGSPQDLSLLHGSLERMEHTSWRSHVQGRRSSGRMESGLDGVESGVRKRRRSDYGGHDKGTT